MCQDQSMAKSVEETREFLGRKVLRDFHPPKCVEGWDDNACAYETLIPFRACPVPVLIRYALTLIDIPYHGPFEKTAWRVPFIYKQHFCWIEHRKLGVRLGISGVHSEQNAKAILAKVEKKLMAAVKIIENLLNQSADAIMKAGNVTIVNQHSTLRDAYDYFRDRAQHPEETVEDDHECPEHPFEKLMSDWFRQERVAQLASYDLIAAISAFMSLLEHELVLLLAFCDFNPADDDLRQILGARWGKKWTRVLGDTVLESVRLRQQLSDVVERWRNTYSHGGFEKNNSATLHLQHAELGALPAGLSGVTDSVLYAFSSEIEMTIETVFRLFDRIDNYLAERFPEPVKWIRSGLSVSFDATFRSEVQESLSADGNLTKMIEKYEYYQCKLDNMEF